MEEGPDRTEEIPDSRALFEFAEAQKEDAQARQREMELKKLELEKSEREAQRALDAQLEDRSNQREHQNRIHKREQVTGGLFVLVAFVFLGYLVWSGNASMVFEIIKVLVYGGAGWAAGRAYGQGMAQINQSEGS